MSNRRQVYDFTTGTGKEKFINDHVKVNEGEWLRLVGYMEKNHDKITFDETERYLQLEATQEVDRIAIKLKR